MFVDDHTEFSQKAMGKTGATQRGEQLSDCLLGSLPHTPAPRQQNRNCGMMVHPAEQSQRGKLTHELTTKRIKMNLPENKYSYELTAYNQNPHHLFFCIVFFKMTFDIKHIYTKSTYVCLNILKFAANTGGVTQRIPTFNN